MKQYRPLLLIFVMLLIGWSILINQACGQGGKLIKIKVNKGETGATGPAGADGNDGREIELQNTGTFIQWRYVGEVSWNNLIDIDDITGADGADGSDGADGTEIELQNSGTYIQWRYVGAGSWTNLIAISAITGSDGSDGADGSVWYEGTGAPSGGTGANGDFYLNDSNGDVYQKSGGSWSIVANIKGADGIGAGTVTSVALTTGTSGTDINVSGSPITSSGTFTLNVPSSSASNRGLLTSTDWSTFNSKIGGSGTASRLPYFSGTSTLANTSLYWDNINIRLGIGAAPNYPLHVAGMALISGLDADITPSPTPYGATKMVIVDSDGLLNTQAIPTSGISGYGATNYMTFWNTSSTISNTDISYGASWGDTGIGFGVAPASVAANIDLATGKTMRFQGTSTIVDKNNSGGSASQIFARAASGGGVDWQSPSELSLENALTFNSPLTRSTNTISIPAATTSVSGHLTSTDWNTFNGKVGGSGVANTVAFWTGTNTLYRDGDITFNPTTHRTTIGLSNTVDRSLDVWDVRIRTHIWDKNNEKGTNNQYLKMTTSGIDWQDGLYGGGTNGYMLKWTSNPGEVENGIVYQSGSDLYLGTGVGNVITNVGSAGVRSILFNRSGSTDASINHDNTNSTYNGWLLGHNISTESFTLLNSSINGYYFDLGGRGVDNSGGIFFSKMAAGGSSVTGMFSCVDSGVFKINNLSGSGDRLVFASSTGTLDDATVANGVSLASGALGLTGQALALHNLSSNGIIARTGSGTVAARTITAGNGIAVTNGDGVSGNPTIAQAMKYASARNTGSETFSLTSSTLKKFDIAVDQQSQGITVDVTDNWLELSETGDYEITVCGQYESADGTGVYYIALTKNSDVGVVDGVLLKDPVGIVPFSFTVIEGFTAGDNIYGSVYCLTSETNDKIHNYKITAKRLY